MQNKPIIKRTRANVEKYSMAGSEGKYNFLHSNAFISDCIVANLYNLLYILLKRHAKLHAFTMTYIE